MKQEYQKAEVKVYELNMESVVLSGSTESYDFDTTAISDDSGNLEGV